MRSRLTRLGATIAALAALAVGGSAIASAASHGSPPAPPAAAQSHEQKGSDNETGRRDAETESTAAEPDGDAAAQAAACQKAGIDPNADNVQYDDQTGTCSLDTGAGSNR